MVIISSRSLVENPLMLRELFQQRFKKIIKKTNFLVVEGHQSVYA